MFISFPHFPDQKNVWENHIILQYRKSSVKRFINFFFVFPDNMEAVAFSKDLACVIYTLSCEKPDDDVIDSDIGFWPIWFYTEFEPWDQRFVWQRKIFFLLLAAVIVYQRCSEKNWKLPMKAPKIETRITKKPPGMFCWGLWENLSEQLLRHIQRRIQDPVKYLKQSVLRK